MISRHFRLTLMNAANNTLYPIGSNLGPGVYCSVQLPNGLFQSVTCMEKGDGLVGSYHGEIEGPYKVIVSIHRYGISKFTWLLVNRYKERRIHIEVCLFRCCHCRRSSTRGRMSQEMSSVLSSSWLCWTAADSRK